MCRNKNMKDNIHTLIIPDVHGRIFWKEAINKFPKDEYKDLVIVFLGDYLDPYEFEGVTKQNAIDNFKEILDIAKSDERIHLLFGNHDMHYWYDAPYKCRVDSKNYKKIQDMFLKNFTMFNVAYEETINNEKYLYTHAGVSKPWLDHLRFIGDLSLKTHIGKLEESQIPFCEMLKEMTPDAEKLNKLKLNFQGQANLWMCSYIRGGDSNCGSCIWEDLSEWAYGGMEIEGIWQIFGHSRWSKSNPDEAYINYDRKFACVDTASAWIILNDGTIKSVNKC